MGKGGGGGGDGEEHEQISFLSDLPSSSSSSFSSPNGQPPFKRTGGYWSAVAHIITAVIGSGVLSLAWSISQLGWIGGPVAMMLFAGITVVSSILLCDCYRSPDPESGLTRNRTYIEAVKLNLGGKSVWLCAAFQQISLYGVGIAYTIASAISMRALNPPACKW